LRFNIGKDLNEDQYNDINALLKSYASVFSRDKLGRYEGVEHTIDVGSNRPVKQKPYRVSHKERQAIQEQVNKMLKDGMIRPSKSPWSSPIVLVKKKDGSLRFCVDYRKLNSATVKDSYPLPRIDSSLDSLGGSEYFSSIDMRSGYWQIGVAEKDRDKTAFITGDGLFEWLVMPFGLCNAGATFERVVDGILGSLRWNICLCYLDDVIIYSKTFGEHLYRIRTVLDCFKRAGLTLNIDKCRFAFKEITIFGVHVSGNGLSPDPEKTKAVEKISQPKSVKDIRSFLGICSYYRRFVKGFADIAVPLINLTKKGIKFQWGEEQQIAFDTLKSRLVCAPVMTHFDPSKEILIHTDASSVGLGAVLVHRVSGTEKVVAYASRNLSCAERNYSTTERECLAVVWATMKFRPYIFGIKFTVVSDHHSLCWLLNLKDPSGRLARWSLRMQEFEFVVEYKSGKKHLDADGLSRLGETGGHTTGEDEYSPMIIGKLEALSFVDDAYMSKIKLSLENGEKASIVENFKVVDGVLYKRNPFAAGKDWLLVVPMDSRGVVLEECHDSPMAGHLGIRKTLDRVRARFFWPGLVRNVISFVNSCSLCQSKKGLPAQPAGLLSPLPPVDSPMERVGIDLMGPLIKTEMGNRWIIVVTDYFTRFAITGALPSGTAEDIARFFLVNVILQFGSPRSVLSDRGKQFTSKIFCQLSKLCEIHGHRTSAYHPQTNGLTERLNKTIADMLSMYINDKHDDWDLMLPYVTFAYNSASQDTTGYSPFFLMYCREPLAFIDILLKYPSESSGNDYDAYIQNMVHLADKTRDLAVKRTLASQSAEKVRYDAKHRHVEYSEGDFVLLWSPVRKVGRSDKFQRRFGGPFRILKKLSEVSYVVEPIEGRKKEQVVHVSRLKKYHQRH
jgi:hypothetical protein